MAFSQFAQRVLDAIYQGPLASDARYLPGGNEGASCHCRVKIGGAEQAVDLAGFASAPVIDDGQVKVRASEIRAPAEGDVFLVEVEGGAVRYLVTQQPERLDDARIEWTCITAAPEVVRAE